MLLNIENIPARFFFSICHQWVMDTRCVGDVGNVRTRRTARLVFRWMCGSVRWTHIVIIDDNDDKCNEMRHINKITHTSTPQPSYASAEAAAYEDQECSQARDFLSRMECIRLFGVEIPEKWITRLFGSLSGKINKMEMGKQNVCSGIDKFEFLCAFSAPPIPKEVRLAQR